jgi:hypothetical protein
MSRDELLDAIASARSLAQSYVNFGTANQQAYLARRVPGVVAMLDKMEERVRASAVMLEPEAFDDIPLGLYAVRELEDVDMHLSKVLCHIQYALKRH